jgi:hypothetical protein
MTMASIKAFTSLSVDDLIVFKVSAYNAAGWGDFSEVNIDGSTIEDVPSIMTTLSFDPLTSTNTQIVLTWSSVASGISSGGSSVSVTSYEILWD